ncbi:YD repeat protein [Leadbetterella byssophila DSM 17132]|uniref:YD repeat protein n=1 Tax=Leadbetterella byssophila (strain DSM 17132 / JCM 16389 / KACC 11308 / NBRC 106382 / 4M15) TaxID=649349 RepID=E4RWK4_LEAB4|nr:T9SS type A sorting domain-containing protein [Leadbetterella byssophila]ADQ18944.1 YD repeat protein [Leadbetterella byssophila DSM 17132]
MILKKITLLINIVRLHFYIKWGVTKQGDWQHIADYAKYYKPVSYWFYPKKEITYTYDANGQNPVTTTTDLYYDNPEHYQLTRQVYTNSDGIVHEEKLKYPLDYKNVSGKDPMLDSLINNHRHNIVIERTISAAGTVQDATAYTFAQFTGNSRKPRLFLPSKEYRYQASGTFVPYSGTSSGINSSSYFENYAVIAYDTLGQAINVRDAAGIHTSVLRAYRARYIVGHLKNALKTDLDLALSSAGTSYNNFLNAADNTTIQNTLTSVQNSLTAAQMSGFLYKPFVGMSRGILPNGTRTDYEYDVFGRLSGIKDHNGNWVSVYEYQLRGNNNSLANHVVSRNLRTATTNASNASNHLNATSLYEFYNAFGELSQKVLWRQTPSTNNIIAENLVRDNVGRISKAHLPVSYASTSTTPLASGTVESTANSFYGEQAYSTTTYRGVSDEVSQTRGPGTAWATNNKNVNYSYGTAGTNVRKYTINTSNDITLAGTYPAWSLISSTVTDEQGNVTTVYKDKKGQTVQTQSQISSGVWAVTYYIYDGLGRIRAVLQPLGYDLNSSIGQSSSSFSNYVFCYEYDARGRVTRKHVPGAGWTETVYDKNNRAVMHQDAYQKTLNRWNFTQYDVHGRVAVSGETTKSTTRASAQSLFDAHTTAFESRTGATYNGASFPSTLQPVSTEKKLLNYYDDYSFLEPQFAFAATGAFHTRNTNIKGLLAGVKKLNSRENAKVYTDAFYYDVLNRMIQSQHTHFLSTSNTANILVKNLEYNFAGEVTKQNVTYPFATGTLTVKNRNDYDHAGRVTTNALGINSEPVDIVHRIYDGIGRLSEKKFIGTGTVPFDSCAVLTDGIVLGTWTVNGAALVARNFHNSWWVTQRIGSNPDRFIVRAYEMLLRGDVTLANPAFASMASCFSWLSSPYGGLEPPATPSQFGYVPGYDYVFENGEHFFKESSQAACSTPAAITSNVPSPTISQSVTLTTSCSTGTPKWNTNATSNSITVTATATATTYSVTCQGSNCTTSSSVSYTVTGSNGPCSTPAAITSNVPSPTISQSVTLTTSCTSGTPKWNTNATSNSITVTATATATTYSVTCQGSNCTTSSSVSYTVQASGCNVLTDGLVMGTWTVTGHSLIARYFHSQWWLVQRIQSSPERFIVRASEMLTRGDVNLNNSSYSGLGACFQWQTSNYGGLEPPATPSVFAVPSGYTYMSENGEYFFQASGPVACSTPATISASVTSPSISQSLTLTTSCSTGTPKWNTNATSNSITVTATPSPVVYSVTCQGGSCTTSPSVSYTVIATPCNTLTDGLVIGTWTVTGHPLIARYFHNKWWLVQRIQTSPERFIVRAAEMISRPDVTLNNSGYTALAACMEWPTSNYGGLEPPATPSLFPVPAGYTYLTENGESFFQKNAGGRMAADYTWEDEVFAQDILLFPNPANNAFEVKVNVLSALKGARVQVVDMKGRAVHTEEYDLGPGINTIKINSSGFENGTYLVNVQKGGYVRSAKIVILK